MPFSARKMRTRRGFGAGCSRRASRDPPSSNCCRHAAGYRGTAATSLAGTGGSIILAIPILMCRSGDLSAFVDRPADIKRLIDFMLSMFPAAPDIDRPRIGFYGFSRGGYTGLVSFGGNPDWACATEFCQRSSAYCCEKIRRKEFPVQASHTTRGSKLASSPTALSVFFTGDSLASVSVPVQL